MESEPVYHAFTPRAYVQLYTVLCAQHPTTTCSSGWNATHVDQHLGMRYDHSINGHVVFHVTNIRKFQMFMLRHGL